MSVNLREKNVPSYNSEEMLRNITFLTSEKTKGRLSGSTGAKNAAKYLANELSLLGIQPAGEDHYFSYLDIFAARLEGAPKLSIADRELKHRIEFGEISRFSNPSGSKVEGKLIVVRDGEEMKEEDLKGRVVLIPERPENLDLAATVKGAEEAGVLGILLESGEPKWFTKGLQGAREKSIPVVRVRKSVVIEIEKLSGEIVTIDLPILSDYRTCQNVIGLLPGIDSSKTLVLSAHYDHLGDDPEGFRFPGAVDNASGIAIILELARKLVKRDLPFNIVFAFFTGEESGLLGAKHFIKQSNMNISAAINIDSLGFEPALNKMRNGHKESGLWLADLAAKVIENHQVEVAWIYGGEDSMAFQAEGIPAIGLGQKPTDSSQRGIHTPDDTLQHLYMEPIYKAHEITSDIVEHLLEHPDLVRC